jgi:hypothetical protein
MVFRVERNSRELSRFRENCRESRLDAGDITSRKSKICLVTNLYLLFWHYHCLVSSVEKMGGFHENI